MKKETVIGKVFALGELEYEFHLNLEDNMMKSSRINPERLNKCEDLYKFEEIDKKITISSKNNLINLLLFINKANIKKVNVEFMPINSLNIKENFTFLKEKLKNDFEKNFLNLLESNIFQINKCKLDISINNNPFKILDFSSCLSNTININKQYINSNHLLERKNEIDKKLETQNSCNELKNKDIQIYSSLNNSSIKEEKVDILNFLDKNSIDNREKISNLFHIPYKFEDCEYFFLDLNQFYHKKKSDNLITIKDIVEFLEFKDINKHSQINIILIFPIDKQQIDDTNSLIKLILMSDLVIYERSQAMNFCKSLGYTVDDKNFELRYVLMDELNPIRVNKPFRHSFFIENFKKLLILTQDIKTRGIPYNVEYMFQISKDYSRAFLDKNFEFLRHIFYGGFFAHYVRKKSFDSCFHAGLSILNKMIDILFNNLPLPVDPLFFIVNNNKKSNILIENIKVDDNRDPVIKKKEAGFALDCLNVVCSKKKEYNPLLDTNLGSFFTSNVVRKHLKKIGIINKEGLIVEENTIKDLISKSNSPGSIRKEDEFKSNKEKSKVINGLIELNQIPDIKLPGLENLYDRKLIKNNHQALEPIRNIPKRNKFQRKSKFCNVKPISPQLYERLGFSSERLNNDLNNKVIDKYDFERLNNKSWKENNRLISKKNAFSVVQMEKISKNSNDIQSKEKSLYNTQLFFTANSHKKSDATSSEPDSKVKKILNSTVKVNEKFNNLSKPNIGESSKEEVMDIKVKYKDFRFFDEKFKANKNNYLEETKKLIEKYTMKELKLKYSSLEQDKNVKNYNPFIKNKDNLIQINNYDGSEIKDKIFESKNGINKIKMNEIREINSENINESEKYNKITNNNLEIRISEASQLNHKKFKIKLEEINKKYDKMLINPQKDLLQIKEDSPLVLRESSSLEIISCESDIKSSKIEEKIVVINQEINQNYSKEKIEKI